MATIALVQSCPYDADLGGDGAYIYAFAEYLHRSGHEVHGLVSDISRGRTSPVYRSAYGIRQFKSWRVRNTVPIGRQTFVGLPVEALRRLSKPQCIKRRSERTIDSWVPREAAWVNATLHSLQPDATVLVHDAVHFLPLLADAGVKFALVGHIPFRQNSLNGDRLISSIGDGVGDRQRSLAFKARLAASLARADGIGFNNRDDMVYAAEDLQVRAPIFVGMGYRGVDLCPESNEPVVLFVGNATGPNRSALSWFLTSIWPTVLVAHPTARFRIVGRVAFEGESQVRASVERVGPVRDLALEYRRAQVVVAPLISGTAGVKIKVAEAMSYGRPLVTTPIGVDIRDIHQLAEAAIVADDPDDFARGVISLLSDGDLRKKKTTGATQVFKNYFSYSACYGEFSSWLERMTQPRLKNEIHLCAKNCIDGAS